MYNLKVFFIIYNYIVYNNEIVFFNSDDASTIIGSWSLFIVHKQHTRKDEIDHDCLLSCCRCIFVPETTNV